MRTDILERRKDILDWININQSKAFMCRELRCKPETLNSYLSKMDIEYAGNMSGKGIKTDPKRLTVKELASRPYVRSHHLKIRMFDDGYKERKCESCDLYLWMDSPIPLELHHIDGDRFNYNLDNLKILCPNCHAQTDSYRGKNTGVAQRQRQMS